MSGRVSRIRQTLRALRGDRSGSMVIETAFVAPMLVLMAVGGFEVSQMVARQHELQGGAAEATSVALAANLGAETDVGELAALLRDSLELQGEQVIVTKVFRCDASSSYVANSSECENYYGNSDSNNGDGNDASRVSSYVKVQITDTYNPAWTKIGIGSTLNFKVNRMVQLS